MQRFIYPPLESARHIRLLRIFPGKTDDDVHGMIFQETLAAAPRYDAVSYVWENDVKNCIIHTSEGFLPVTTSLYSAVKRIRFEENSTVIWADSICINQDDNQEKAIQIRLMRDIFERALHVLAYLGEAADDSHLVPELMNAIANADLDSDPDKLRQGDFTGLGLPAESDPAWAAGRAFFRRPWWQRVWIVQEIVVASEVVVICGPWTVGWDLILCGVYKAREHHIMALQWSKNEPSSEVTSAGFTAAWRLIVSRIKFQGGTRLPLLVLLGFHGFTKATKARDHLFALLGLAKDADDATLDPDYEGSLESVVTRYARFFILRDKSLRPLYEAGTCDPHSRFPSWVPDWTIDKKSVAGGYLDTDEDFYHAAGSSSTQPRFSDDSKVLIVKGGFVDAIAQVGFDYTLKTEKEGIGRELYPLLKRLRDSDRMLGTLESYPTGEQLSEVYWRTLIANKIRGQVPPPTLERSYEAFRTYLKKIQGIGGRLDTKSAEAATLWADMQPYSIPLLQLFEDVVFCVTEKGYVGLAPRTAAVGDVISIFLGCALPLVLRKFGPDTNEFYLVGGSYIHGIMEGEALASEDWREEEIFLR
ncbi:hypothetical protein GP486_003299 [Trichoglossum hirsutum]|uniref:Heterokaryon incompatibility domain-containing protein n=1 Tax=Trichoglossum hirsutum TaxID=265104 RepID=A0A9P8LCV3_9PEZI|nr:hypothetical protein GP486_003299 [Trichoglossum hirsutum]